LHPYSRNSEIVVRFSGTPVYSFSNTNKSTPDGVLIYGDIANGKAAITETAVASAYQNGEFTLIKFLSKPQPFRLRWGVSL
jgi:hypothetical protein